MPMFYGLFMQNQLTDLYYILIITIKSLYCVNHTICINIKFVHSGFER